MAKSIHSIHSERGWFNSECDECVSWLVSQLRGMGVRPSLNN